MQRKGEITTEYCGIPGYGYNARNYPSSFPIEVGFPEVIRGVMGKANEFFFYLHANVVIVINPMRSGCLWF